MSDNRKGVGFIYVIVIILIMLMVMPTILMNPIQIKRKEKIFDNKYEYTKSISQLNAYIMKDIIESNYNINFISSNKISIGENSYTFKDGVKRNDNEISKINCQIKKDNEILNLKCLDVELLFPLFPNTNSRKR